MGKSCSKPLKYPELDPIFLDMGCIGLLKYEYSEQQRFDNAPFYVVKFISRDYASMLDAMIDHIRNTFQPPNLVDGPIYFATAIDFDKGEIHSYLFFPNLNKETRQKYTNMYEKGVYHRWMRRLLTSSMYKVQTPPKCSLRNLWDDSQSKYACQLTPRPQVKKHRHGDILCKPRDYLKFTDGVKRGDPVSFMYGCRSDNATKCIESKSQHKRMGIYDKKKKAFHYPNTYFHVYKINRTDIRVSQYIDQSSENVLTRNILSAGLDMYVGCKSMLISNNNMYCFVLGNRRIGLYRNLDVQSECSTNLVPKFQTFFKGYTNTRLVIEDSILMIYSAGSPSDGDQPVFNIRIAPNDAEHPLALVVEDTGAVVVYDRLNTKRVLIDSDGVLDSSSTGMNMDGSGSGASVRGKGFDVVAEFKERLRNLYAYLRLPRILLKEMGIDAELALDEGIPVPSIIYEKLPPYDPNMDYISRWNEWLTWLLETNRMNAAMFKAYYINAVAQASSSLKAQKAQRDRALAEAAARKAADIADANAMTDSDGLFSKINDAEAEKLESEIDAAEKEEAEKEKQNEENKQAVRDALITGVDVRTEEQPAILDRIPNTPNSQAAIAAEDAQSREILASYGVDMNSIMGRNASSTLPTTPKRGYDLVTEKQRRLENLYAYLMAIHQYVADVTGVDILQYNVVLPSRVIEKFPAFNVNQEYKTRYNMFINDLVHGKRLLDGSDFYAYFIKSAMAQGAEGKEYRTWDETMRRFKDAGKITQSEYDAYKSYAGI